MKTRFFRLTAAFIAIITVFSLMGISAAASDYDDFVLNSNIIKHSGSITESNLYSYLHPSDKRMPGEGYYNGFYIDMTDTDIIEMTASIIGEETVDYMKLELIYDWICENIYYDNDYLHYIYGEEYTGTLPYPLYYSASETLEHRHTVCEGYTNLLASMLACAGIPSVKVEGYAIVPSAGQVWDEETLTGEDNHAWNEAYIDGRWIILDSTWDTFNYYEYGEFHEGNTYRNYFDISIEDFSVDHRISNYVAGGKHDERAVESTEATTETAGRTVYYCDCGYEYVVVTPRIGSGDVDLSGVMTIADALILFKYAAGTQPLSEVQISFADVDGDGAVGILDALILFRYISTY